MLTLLAKGTSVFKQKSSPFLADPKTDHLVWSVWHSFSEPTSAGRMLAAAPGAKPADRLCHWVSVTIGRVVAGPYLKRQLPPALPEKCCLCALLPVSLIRGASGCLPEAGSAWTQNVGQVVASCRAPPSDVVLSDCSKWTRQWPLGREEQGGHSAFCCLVTSFHSLFRWWRRHLVYWPEDQRWERWFWKASCDSWCVYEHVKWWLCENVHRWVTKPFARAGRGMGSQKTFCWWHIDSLLTLWSWDGGAFSFLWLKWKCRIEPLRFFWTLMFCEEQNHKSL